MIFVEFLRVRSAARIVASFLAAIILGTTMLVVYAIHTKGVGPVKVQHAVHSAHSSNVRISVNGNDVDDEDDRDHDLPDVNLKHATSLHDIDFKIPLGIVLGTAGFVAIIFATILGTSLNKENLLGGFAFTKPISRARLALSYFAVDAAGVVAIFLFTVLLGLISLTALQIVDKVFVDAQSLPILAIALGAAAMWYGLLQVATVFLRFPASMFIGIGWGAFLILIALTQVNALGPAFHAVVMTLNYLNPLAYYSGVDVTGTNATTSSVFGFSEATRIAVTWSIAIVTCTIAAQGWKRVEV
jgi:hypothetical protein